EPAQPDLPALRGRLAEARQQTVQQRDDRLDRAEALLQRGRLTAPREDNAIALFREVLALDPGNQRARRGVERIATSLNQQFERAAADYEVERASDLLASLESHQLLSDRELSQ